MSSAAGGMAGGIAGTPKAGARLWRPKRLLILALIFVGLAKITLAYLETMTPSQAPSQARTLFSVVPPASAAENTEAEMAAAKPAEMSGERPKTTQLEIPEVMLAAIVKERALLKVQKSALEQRRAEVDLAVEKLQIETARLASLKQDLEDLLGRVEAAKTRDLERLVSLYSTMKPKDAAGILNEMDIEVTVLVLGSMKERAAAPIFARLNKVRARAISKIILERSKLPGDQQLNGLRLR